ncbi:MAG: hypothetical protein AB1505_34775 [Candidatus Latescibacterota bacterium]
MTMSKALAEPTCQEACRWWPDLPSIFVLPVPPLPGLPDVRVNGAAVQPRGGKVMLKLDRGAVAG